MKTGLYVHIPFCVKKCPYCSFAVAVGQTGREEDYISALEREALVYKGTAVDSIYIGGGTPSCLTSSGIEKLFRLISDHFKVSAQAEITFEANPESITTEKGRLLRTLGVDRISLGVQSLNDARLGSLGRTHDADQARRAFDMLRVCGFSNISIDVMYGFPQQTHAALAEDLKAVLALKSDHVSLYALNIEQRSLFFARGKQVDADAQADMYEIVRRVVEAEGFLQYEVSNFAKPGFSSAHNINYWRGGEYIGLGMSGHSHRDGRRYWNADTLPLYLSMMQEKGNAMTGEERLCGVDKLTETFLFGLRMNEGVDLNELERRMNVELPMEKKEALESFIEMGLLEEDGLFIRATDQGRLVLDEISARLI
jgi:oxygen-independent coproporphyrinogen III oxidase